MPSVIQELPSSKEFYGRRCVTFTSEPMTLKTLSCSLAVLGFTFWGAVG